jgi:hypothetical protein
LRRTKRRNYLRAPVCHPKGAGRSRALRLETYISDAERDGDNEVVEPFRKAQADSKKGAEAGKRLLAQRIK